MVAQTTSRTERRQQAINRAMDKAHDQVRAGNLPALIATRFDGRAIRETWRVHSRTTRTAEYAVILVHNQIGVGTDCTCAATGVCWHRALVRLAHFDAIPARNEAGYRFRPRVAS